MYLKASTDYGQRVHASEFVNVFDEQIRVLLEVKKEQKSVNKNRKKKLSPEEKENMEINNNDQPHKKESLSVNDNSDKINGIIQK